MELDPEDPFEAVVAEMVTMNRKKRKDYAGEDHPFQNFYDSAYQQSATGGNSCECLIATKQSRLRTLLRDNANAPENESIEDTLIDRAVYTAIAVAIYKEGGYDPNKQPWL